MISSFGAFLRIFIRYCPYIWPFRDASTFHRLRIYNSFNCLTMTKRPEPIFTLFKNSTIPLDLILFSPFLGPRSCLNSEPESRPNINENCAKVEKNSVSKLSRVQTDNQTIIRSIHWKQKYTQKFISNGNKLKILFFSENKIIFLKWNILSRYFLANSGVILKGH